MNQVEERLREQLHRHVDHLPVGDGWAGVHRRIERRERGTQRRRAALTVGMVAVLCAGAVTLAGKAGQGRTVRTPATQPTSGGALPRLVLGLNGLQFETAYAADPGGKATVEVPVDKPGAPALAPAMKVPGETHLALLTTPSQGLSGPTLFVRTTVGGSALRPNPLATQVQIGDQPAMLQQVSGLPSRSLTWQAPSGPLVLLSSAWMTADDLVAAGRAIVVDAQGGVTWATGAPPADLQLVRTSQLDYLAPRSEAEADYTWHGDRMTLRVQSGDDGVLDDLVADRMAGAREMAQFSIGGQPAAWIGMEDGSLSVIWEVRRGVVAELIAEGDARPQAQAALASITEIPGDVWDAMVKRSIVPTKAKGKEGVADPAGSPQAELCRLRALWLTGDAAARAKTALVMQELLDKGTAAGWGKDGDLLPVFRTVAQAMQAGDVATVTATPAGGCP